MVLDGLKNYLDINWKYQLDIQYMKYLSFRGWKLMESVIVACFDVYYYENYAKASCVVFQKDECLLTVLI